MKSNKKIISEVINEYLNKDASYSRHDMMDNSILRYDQDEIIKNEWLFHGTDKSSAVSIVNSRFKGYKELDFGLTYAGLASDDGNVAFAFRLDRSGDENNGIASYILGKSDALVVFQANGFVDYYEPDDCNEIIFDISTVHNAFVVYKVHRGRSYFYLIPLKNGREIIIKDTKYLENNKLFRWVSNNYDTYKHAIDINNPPNFDKYFPSNYPQQTFRNVITDTSGHIV